MDATKIDGPGGSLASAIARAVPGAPGSDGAVGAAEPRAGGFGDVVTKALDETNRAQRSAEEEVRKLAEGRGDVVETMLALTKADVALKMTLQLRNRALDAYQEILRVQV